MVVTTWERGSARDIKYVGPGMLPDTRVPRVAPRERLGPNVSSAEGETLR